MPNILILDMSYTLKMIRENQLEQALDSRKLDGFFGKMISAHPLAGLFESGNERFGDPLVIQLDDSHTFVEGKLGSAGLWQFIPPLNFLCAQIKLLRLLLSMARDAEVQVIRIGDPYYLGLIGLFLSWRLKVPLVIRVCFRYDEIFRVTHRPIMPRLFRYRWIEKIVERLVFSRCDLIAGANQDNMRYALENGGRPEIATIFRYGNLIYPNHWEEPNLRENAAEKLSELGLLEGCFLVTVARLEPMKYVADAIRALAELRKRGHLVKGLIVGTGTLRGELEHLANALGVADALIFAGNRTQDWLASVLPKAAVIISPHMGRALTEAALAGVPMVAYDYDWQREVVIDGQTGYLVPHKDWVGLADKTQMILTDPVGRKRMGMNARCLVTTMMNPQALEQHEKNEYTKLLARSLKIKRTDWDVKA